MLREASASASSSPDPALKLELDGAAYTAAVGAYMAAGRRVEVGLYSC
jgi:hypothetical protein